MQRRIDGWGAVTWSSTNSTRDIDVAEECSVVVADTPRLIAECLRLRYQVYSLEKGYEPGANGVETDIHDDRAHHVLLRHRTSGEAIGTVRIITALAAGGLEGLPMSRACAAGLLSDLPLRSTGEISRFAVSKARRLSCGASTMVRLGLMQGVLQLSVELGLSHWVAIMEPMLLRLLQRNAIHFAPLGPLVEFHGTRQPAWANIGQVLSRTRYEQGRNWEYVTKGGELMVQFENTPERQLEVA